MMSRGEPSDGRDFGAYRHRYVETPVQCNGMVCRAVYERAGDGYVFRGVDHGFWTADGEYEVRRETAEDWEKRTDAGLEYAPVGYGVEVKPQ